MNKITLDHTAVRKLIEDGGDEYKFQLRGAVLKAAAENAGAMAGKELNDELKGYARTKMHEEIGKVSGYWSNPKLELDPKFKAVLMPKIQEAIKISIDNIINEQVNVAEIMNYATERAEAAVERLQANIDALINTKIDELTIQYINNTIKNRLETAKGE